jgi:hypothetical protein
MRKNLIYALIIIAIGGCTKFDDIAKDGETEVDYKANPTQAALVTVSTYKELGDLIDDAGWWFWAQEVSSDEVVFPIRLTDWNDGGKWKVLHEHAWDNNTDAVNSMWSHMYDGVNEANRAIEGLESSAGIPTVDLTIAKLKTLRAFFYYLLIDNYGDVPYITSFSGAGENPLKTPKADIWTNIVADLEASAILLPSATNKFAVSKGMAHTLLAKLYINAAEYKGSAEYLKAENYCDSVINSGVYSLDLNSVTNAFKADNDGAAENIFTVPFDEFDLKGFRLHMRTLHYLHDDTYGMTVGPWNGFGTVENHYNSYDDNDLRKKEWFIVGQQKGANGNDLFDETAGAKLVINPRIPQLVLDGSNSLEEVRMSGARVGKYEIASGTGENLSNDFPLFRYADVLLMKAECAVRNGAPGAGDTYAAEVRDRANAGATSGFGLDEILAERGRELFCEGHRRQDLIRFGKFGNSWWEKPTSGPDRKTFPIPQWAIDANPNLGL